MASQEPVPNPEAIRPPNYILVQTDHDSGDDADVETYLDPNGSLISKRIRSKERRERHHDQAGPTKTIGQPKKPSGRPVDPSQAAGSTPVTRDELMSLLSSLRGEIKQLASKKSPAPRKEQSAKKPAQAGKQKSVRDCANEIGGPLIVLQFWAWEHIHVGRPGRPAIHRRGEQDQDDQYQAYDAPPLPTPDEAYGCRWVVPRLTHAHAARGLPYYRDALDRLTEDQVTWDPYVPDLVDAMPPHLLDHQAEWRARVPLICFEVVESHLPDRVMRQFGLRQTIPQGCDTSVQLHGIDRRGKGETSWALEHWRFLQLWEQRLEFIVGGDLMQGAMDPDDPYMVWYRRITRRFINPSYAPPSTHYHPAYDIISGYAADMVAMVDALSVSLECGPTRAQVEQVRDMGVATLRRYGHAHLAHRRDGHDGNSQFDLGQSSGGCDPTSPRHAEDYNIHSTAPSGTQEDPSSSQLTPPPPRDPFTTVTHYRRRRVRRRADTQEAGPLPRINESG
ncbi:serine/threonine-protein phosphatase 7 long form homolog [Chenopodium quinoa]|uniref:serine/threonine-protein phosphatase 7 long form homolog n=1 Tax=Chenopodium quinoa TaxID=63459 RepID=UPI000B784630|nr:serine/threonine-protein phosphatase 7 long form homolog [Chenopodium quinoa]